MYLSKEVIMHIHSTENRVDPDQLASEEAI